MAAETFLRYELKPRTIGQSKFLDALKNAIVTFCDGPAGTGKTHIPTTFAVDAIRFDNDISRVILTRPIVDAGRSIGYLPGTMEEKVHPYLMPIYDELGYSLDPRFLQKLLRERVIEICPLPMMRGRNFHRAFIVCDEAQNATYKELKTLLTRMGRHSKVCISGDLNQTDLPQDQSGAYLEMWNRLHEHPDVNRVSLTSEDVVRSRFVSEIESLL